MSSSVQAADLVLTAASMAGPVGSNRAAWLAKVMSLIPEAGALITEGSREMELAEHMLDTTRLVTHYGGYEVEETSTRLVISFQNEDGSPALDQDGDHETIRSERTDRPTGRAMRQLLDGLQVGQKILVWKHMESNPDHPMKKFRVALHIRPLGKVLRAADPEPTRSAPTQPPAADAVPPRPADSDDLDIPAKIRQIMSKLTPAGNARWFAKARDAGIDIDHCRPDQFAEARRLALEIHAAGMGATEPQPIPPEEEESF